LNITKSMKKSIHFIKKHAEPRIKDLKKRYNLTLNAGQIPIANILHNELQFYHSAIKLADLFDKVPSSQDITIPMNPTPTILLSSLFMSRLRDYQQVRPPEQVVGYITGYLDPASSIRIPFEIIDLHLQNTTMFSAMPALTAISDALNVLESKSHPLLAIVHSHYGTGPMAIHPSSVDLSTVKTLEQAYGAIGIIFDETGTYFRCFSAEQDFVVKIVGKGIKEVDGFDGDVFRFD